MQHVRIIVIGGGAAGFFGAIATARINPFAQVIILEASQQLLTKVRISGGGRCNVTHACFDVKALVQNYPRGNKALIGAFSRFQPQDTVAWFNKHGVQLKTEADGRMFPITDSSETIVDCLLSAAKMAGVKICTGTSVVSVDKIGSEFTVVLKSGEKLECDRVLIATGSNPVGYRIAEGFGHIINTPVPSLFTFNIRDESLRELAGVSINPVKLRLNIPEQPQLEQTGALLITHWGMSGPAVLKLSAWGARALHESKYQAVLSVNWLPELKPEEIRDKLLATKAEVPRRSILLHRGIDIPHRLWQYMVVRVGINSEIRWAEISKKHLNLLIQELSQGQYLVNGKGVFKDEFVTCGGVNLKEVDFKRMASRLVPGLYFAGEVLDIDGVTGGFNFQSAWTTSYLAGLGMASDEE
ncbi:NAD(P)/FAD-dependent oxidoreductase [Calothrix sp. UHCC 0171]|uniref:NAD(P)/FAD-dependent oxidoreductase n=1 Tax=Calothrix sp. UHCC 0171 TaxID=3110245 RepID=UPI002B215E51|nr:NAD(P)/FAD-dependent oxidoreductase [Calothrix sp. UHCC 0171]MEA5573382.1 NAD(P)/FAD-dependent oxidoreductase [Calothrix sp. UHCC 0171]